MLDEVTKVYSADGTNFGGFEMQNVVRKWWEGNHRNGSAAAGGTTREIAGPSIRNGIRQHVGGNPVAVAQLGLPYST